MATNRYTDGSYLEQVPDWHASDAPWKASQVLRMLSKNSLHVHSLTDLGCGVGEVLVELQKKLQTDTVLTGYDISPQAIAIAKTKENDRLHFFNDDFMSSAAPVPDVLLLLDVFEHLQDYIGFLAKLNTRANWFVFHIPLEISALSVVRKSRPLLYMREHFGHLHHFTKQTAFAALTDAGYDIVDFFYTDDFTLYGTPTKPARRMYYEARRLVARANADFAASLFSSYNVMVLARGSQSAAS